MDVDGVGDPNEVRDALARLPHCVFAARSVAGGAWSLLAVDPIPQNDAEHKVAWQTVTDYVRSETGYENDAATKDVSRLRFLAADQFATADEDAKPLPWSMPEPVVRARTKSKEENRGRLPTTETMQGWLATRADPDCDYADWLRVGMSLHGCGYPISVWDDWSAGGKGYQKGVCEKKWLTFNATKDEKVGIGWLKRFMAETSWPRLTSRGVPQKGSPLNVMWGIEKMDHQFAYNEFTNQKEVDGRPIDDRALDSLYVELDDTFSYNPTIDAFHKGVGELCSRNPYHPVREYLQRCADGWDRKLRLNKMGETYLGTASDPLQNATARLILWGAAARVLSPGAKFDYMPVIHSLKQGKSKSSALKLLAGEWYGEGLDLGAFDLTKTVMERTTGVWILECADLALECEGRILRGLRARSQRRETAHVWPTGGKPRTGIGSSCW